jgi:hypothetical protein
MAADMARPEAGMGRYVPTLEGQKPVEGHCCNWLVLKKYGVGCVHWIILFQDKVSWLAFVNTVMKRRVLLKAELTNQSSGFWKKCDTF